MNLTQNVIEVRGIRKFAVMAACVALGLGTCASALALHMDVSAPPQNETQVAPIHGAAPKVSGGVMAGNILTKVNPLYPQEARDAKITGAVVLRAVIGKDGKVENLRVVSGPKELQSPSLDAVRQWTYKPYLLNGNPVEVETTVTVNFALQP